MDSISVKWKPVFFFVAGHLLVGQLCTNPKSDRSLLSCLKVTLCSTSEIGDTPLYNSCFLLIQVMKKDHCQHPQNSNLDCHESQGRAQDDESKVCGYGYGFGVVSSEGHIMPPHIFKVGLKVNTKVYQDMLKSVVILWYNQIAGGRPWVWQQDSALATSPNKPMLGFRRRATTLYPSLTGPLKMKAATLNRCQLYYINKLAELIFSIKVLK